MEAWQFTLYLIAYSLSSCISLFLAFIAWNLKPINGSRIIGTGLFAIAIWLLSYAIQIASTNISVKLFFVRFEYLGLITALYLWFVFVVYYTEYKSLSKPWVLISIAIVPVLTLIMVLTLNSHTLLYHEYHLETINNLKILIKTYSVGFYFWIGYAYFLLMVSLLVVLYKAISMPLKYRKQIMPIAIAATILILPNILYITGKNPIHPFDPTGIAFVFVGIIIIYSLHVQSFLNLVPIAHGLVIKNAKMGIVILDEKNKIIEINPAAQKTFECNINDCIGQPIESILSDFYELKEALVNKKESIIEVNIGHKNITYEIKIAALKKENGIQFGSIIMLWDISELKAAFYELDAYAHTVAHDLKTPINQMVGYANILQNTVQADEETELMLSNIVEGGLKMSEIIDELLKLAEIRSLDAKDIKPINLDTLINSVIKRVLPDDIIENTISKPDTWPEIYGNHIWVEEVWANLISNAYKYGGSLPKITLGFTELKDYYHFFVKDNGIGIGKDEMKKLFTEYSRLSKHKHKVVGHGLGLSIAYRIIKKMGGKIWAESKLKKGSTFYFSLPKPG